MTLTAQSLTCRRGGRRVFRDLGFTLGAGELLVVTGANGGGKSSLLRLLAGLLEPEFGVVLWQGKSIADDLRAYQKNLTYIGHLDALKPELTVREMLDFWAALQGAARPSSEVLAPFDLAPLEFRLVRHLSAGQKRRVALTRLLLRQAPLWLLDEPTTALDARSQEQFLAVLDRHRAQGGLAVVASHHELNVADAQELALL